MRPRLAGVGIALWLGALAALARPAAAGFPDQPIRLIVPFPPGGTTDIVMRAFAELAAKRLAVAIVIENRPGAAGTLGPASLLNAKPDGYTLSQMPMSVFRQPFMAKVNYDPRTDFSYVIQLTGYAFGVVVRGDARWPDWAAFVADSKAHPGKNSYGTPGIGSTLHVTMEEIALQRGVSWLHVPYKGLSETTNALLAGEVDSVADSTGWAPYVQTGQFRLLVTWGAQRIRQFPAAPTLGELGYGIVSNSPYGIAGPKGLDPAVVRRLHDAFKDTLFDPAFKTVMQRYDQEPAYLDSAGYAAAAVRMLTEQQALLTRLGLAQPH
jgi:tripartite-type tricarboxylate transporter receptor subunit TctC